MACNNQVVTEFENSDQLPLIHPDYQGVTLPYNIAPLNFVVREPGSDINVRFYGDATYDFVINGTRELDIPMKKWKKLLQLNQGRNIYIDIFIKNEGKWIKFKSLRNQVANEPIDAFLTYRLIEPSYVAYSHMGIYQRNIENFDTKSILDNQLTDKGCMNCHSFQGGKTDRYMIHLRGENGGTLIVDHKNIAKVKIKGAVYPQWHPHENLIAFSANKIGQLFHASSLEKVEVLDTKSDLLLYDGDKNATTPIVATDDRLETFPSWSADGKMLYFCSAKSPVTDPKNIEKSNFEIAEAHQEIRYDILQKSFDPHTKTFGPTDTLLLASEMKKSASFPRISPDGRFMMVTLSDYGNFSIWHKSADLYLIDLKAKQLVELKTLNSPDVESYHSWSSNGRWVVFSSRRDDGSYTRPYIAYIDANGITSKPFIVPQKSPRYYNTLYQSFNIPELTSLPVNENIRELEEVSNSVPEVAVEY
jgi:Tol biopolymer transport system component